MSETLIERAYRILLEENRALSERLSKAERTVYDQSAQIEMVCKLWNAAQPDIVRLFEIQPTFGDNETEVDGQACHELQKAFAKINWHCVPDVKADRNALVARNHELIGLVLRMRDRWWPFVHGSVAPSNTAYQLGKESADIISKTPQQCLLDVHIERDALAAQVEFLRSSIDKYQALGDEVILREALTKTPQQCLRDVQAEAGRLGYIEGATNHNPDYDEEYCAELYAAKVRQGGAA